MDRAKRRLPGEFYSGELPKPITVSRGISLFKKFRIALPIVGVILLIGVFGLRMIGALTFTFIQTHWDGGASPYSYPNATSNNTGWTSYYSKENIDNSDGSRLVLTTGSSTITQTTNIDFSGGVFDQTRIAKTGEEAEITLANQNPQDIDTWSEPSMPPFDLLISPSVISAGTDMYAFVGNGSDGFYKYNTITDEWTVLANTPQTIRWGGTMVYYPPDNVIYAFRGTATIFWKYDIDANEWSVDTPALQATREGAQMVYPGDWDPINYPNGVYELYVISAGSVNYIQKYNVNTGVWTMLATPPSILARGADIEYPGSGKYLYAMQGGGFSNAFWKYSMADNRWNHVADGGTPASLPGNPYDGAQLIRTSDSNILYMLLGNENFVGSTDFYQYDISDGPAGTWSALTSTPAKIFEGAGAVYVDGRVYALERTGPASGNLSTNFWRYDEATTEWSTIQFPPAQTAINLGGALAKVDDGNGNIYAFLPIESGGASSSRRFYRFNSDANGGFGEWTQLADAPGDVYYGADLAYDNVINPDVIYATQGNTGGVSAFWKYTISTNSWTTGLPSPGNVGHGSGLAFDSSTGNLYITMGGGTTEFKRCLITLVSECAAWTAAVQGSSFDQPDQSIDRGGDIAYTGGGVLYVLQGGFNSNLLRYNISSNTWVIEATTPGNTAVAEGSAMMYPGFGNFLYIYPGNNSRTFWRYNIVSTEWESLRDAPGAFKEGSDIMFPGVGGTLYLYVFQGGYRNNFWRYAFRANYFPIGDFESSIIDTTENIGFGQINWDDDNEPNTYITMKVRTSNDPAMTGAPDWSTCIDVVKGQTIGSGGNNCVTDTHRYVQYQATLGNNGSTLNTSRLEAVHIEYLHFNYAGELLGSAFNTEDPTNVVSALMWDENAVLPSGTGIMFQIRTAPDAGGVPGTWTNFLGPTGTGDYFDNAAPGCTKVGTRVTCTGIHSSHLDAEDDQWFQYRAVLTSLGANTAQLDEVHVQYVINTAPVVTIANVPEQDIDSMVEIVYSISDAEELSLTTYFLADVGAALENEIFGSISTADIELTGGAEAQFPPTGGTILVGKEMINYASRSGTTLTGITRGVNQTRATSHPALDVVWLRMTQGVDGSDNLGVLPLGGGYNVTWDVPADLIDFYKGDARVRILAVDGNAANQVGYDDHTLVLDTKAPESLGLAIDSRTDELTISASDNSTIQMKLSNNADLSFDSDNGESGQWIIYEPVKSWVPRDNGDGTETVYAQFRDQYGNTSSIISSTTPQIPDNLIMTDISYVYGSDYKVFLSWQRIDPPVPGFAAYDVYMSTEGSDPEVHTFTYEASITDINENFYVDSELDIDEEYNYRVVARDLSGNVSNYNQFFGVQQGASIDWGSGIQPGVGGGSGSIIAPVITNVEVAGVDEESAVITWSTDKLSNALVAYSTTPATYTEQVGVTTMQYNHSVTLTGLTAGQTYYFKVISYDALNNKGESIDDNVQRFTTGADSIAPIISNVGSIAGVTSAGITWSTDEPANSQVEYGTTDTYGETTTLTADYVVGHSVTLTDLQPQTTYYFRVRSADLSGNSSVSDGGTFDTLAGLSGTVDPDLTAPAISNVVVSSPTSNGISISFQTSEPSRGLVEYGKTTDYERGDTSGNIATFLTLHSINLLNLTPATTYNFALYAIDESGNIGQTANSTFITQPEPPVEEITPGGATGGTDPPQISAGPSVRNVTATTAVVAWSTSEPATSVVIYRPEGSTGEVLLAGRGATYANDHSIRLAGLTPNTSYEYQVRSQDTDNNFIVSQLSTFRTASTPSLSNVRVANLTFNSASVAWQTSIPSNSIVEFGTQSGVYDQILTDEMVSLTHQIDMPNLATGGTYFFVVKGRSADGNILSSDEYVFSTKSTPSVLNLEVSNLTPVSAELNFETNLLAQIRVDYENTKNNTQGTKVGDGLGNRHTILLGGLSPNTFYTFVVSMTDQLGDTYESVQFSFQTADDQVGPTISLIETRSNINDDDATVQAIISWNTDEESSAQVKYTESVGATTYTFNSDIGRDFGKDHIVILNDLKPSTAYQFIVISEDQSGNETISDPNVMLTPGLRVSIFELIFGSLEDTFSWLENL